MEAMVNIFRLLGGGFFDQDNSLFGFDRVEIAFSACMIDLSFYSHFGNLQCLSRPSALSRKGILR